MKLMFMCLALAALPALAGDRQPDLPSVLYTTFQQPAPLSVTRAMQDEVESVMGPLGRHFVWRSIAGVRGSEVASELAVLTFKGHCDVSGLAPKEAHPPALGWTHVSDGAILPFAEIECDRIKAFLQKELLYLPPEDREEAFGRAMARVVSHELYHIFANTQHHGSDGIGKSAYTVQELLADDFQFEERDGHAMRTGGAPAATQKTAGTP